LSWIKLIKSKFLIYIYIYIYKSCAPQKTLFFSEYFGLIWFLFLEYKSDIYQSLGFVFWRRQCLGNGIVFTLRHHYLRILEGHVNTILSRKCIWFQNLFRSVVVLTFRVDQKIKYKKMKPIIKFHLWTVVNWKSRRFGNFD